MSNTSIVKTANERLDEITKLLSHDPKSLELLDGVKKHLDSYGDLINIEGRINNAVDAKYAVPMMRIKSTSEFDNFMTFFNDATARLRFAFDLARKVDLTEIEMEFLVSNATDATKGDFEEIGIEIDLPTREQVNAIVEGSPLAPAVELWKRMETFEKVTAEASKARWNRIQKETSVMLQAEIAKKESEADAIHEQMRAYDPSAEVRFQNEVAAQLRREEDRLDIYKMSGHVDPGVEVNPKFLAYPDQLAFNITVLKAKAERGSEERWAQERREQRYGELLDQIQSLTEAQFFAQEREEAEADAATSGSQSGPDNTPESMRKNKRELETFECDRPNG